MKKSANCRLWDFSLSRSKRGNVFQYARRGRGADPCPRKKKRESDVHPGKKAFPRNQGRSLGEGKIDRLEKKWERPLRRERANIPLSHALAGEDHVRPLYFQVGEDANIRPCEKRWRKGKWAISPIRRRETPAFLVHPSHRRVSSSAVFGKGEKRRFRRKKREGRRKLKTFFLSRE